MIYTLSPREKQVTDLLLQGKSNKQIALSLSISERTVQFHLKNIYAKCGVSSRVELILKLGNITGATLWESTVASEGENAENRDRSRLRMGWTIISIIGKELKMKTVLNAKHVFVGSVTAILTGLIWVALMRTFAHMALEEITPWVGPLLLVWALLGLAVGLAGKRFGSSLLKVAFGAFFGAGVGPLVMLPVMGFVVVPLIRLGTWLGLINRAAISQESATFIAILAMLMIWLAVGIIIGSALQSKSIFKLRRVSQLSEQSL